MKPRAGRRVRVLVLHGPNLNLTGIREPEIYGTETLAGIDRRIRALAAELSAEVRIVQSNHEGALVDELHRARTTMDAVVLNPGALAHTSLVLADAVRGIALPCVEVHLTNLFRREPARRHSYVSEAASGFVAGLGPESYLLGLRAAVVLARSGG